MTFASALVIAAAYWHGQGYAVPCHPTPVVKPTAEMPIVAPAAGQPPRLNPYAEMAALGCDVWLSPAARSYSRDPDMESTFCADVVHEVGHVIGLGHTATGIMAADGIFPQDVPSRCVRHYVPLHRYVVHGWDGRTRRVLAL